MNDKLLPSPTLQTLFVSREASNCPLIAEIIRLGHGLEKQGMKDKDSAILSLNYGKRLLINGKNTDVKTMQKQDVVEIVDYDPLKNIMMVIGTKEPCVETAVHWIIQKARHDINAVLQIKSISLFENLKGKLPVAEIAHKKTSLDRAKEILATLQKGNSLLLNKEGVLLTGITIKEIDESLQSIAGGTP